MGAYSQLDMERQYSEPQEGFALPGFADGDGPTVFDPSVCGVPEAAAPAPAPAEAPVSADAAPAVSDADRRKPRRTRTPRKRPTKRPRPSGKLSLTPSRRRKRPPNRSSLPRCRP